MIHIIGDSFAPEIFRQAARHVGIPLCGVEEAQLVFICQDVETDADGTRHMERARYLVSKALMDSAALVVVTSQVEPGFTRKFNTPRLYCQAETLRIKDAFERAIFPEQHIIGCMNPDEPLPIPYWRWIERFPAPMHKMTYEEAEFAKIAINVTLAHQVTLANALSAKASSYGCEWGRIANILRHDKRIGPHAYLTPGDWRESPHLLRDYKTFYETISSNSADA